MTAGDALRVKDLRVRYGGIAAVKGISLEVDKGEIVTLIGANGAGKTSTLKAIVGLVPAQSGEITLFGESIRGVATPRIAGKGVALVPEGRAIFGNLTVAENLELGAFLQREPAGMAARLERVLKLFPRLSERMAQEAGTLSGGEQQMLAIGLLDEPSLGLAPKLVEQIFEAIVEVARGGLTILLVEQNTRLALETASRAYVLVTGELALCGGCPELRADPRIKGAYLGEDVSA